MFTITLTGPARVTDDETERPITDPGRLRTFDGLHSGKETCSKYHDGAVADLGLKGGQVRLVFDAETKKLRVVSAFTGPRKLAKDELAALIADTRGQWSDGIGEGCFDDAMDRRKVFIELVPDGRGKVTATQADDGRPAPKVSAAKERGLALVKAAEDGALDEVKELVAAGAKLDGRGRYGFTPLVAAVSSDHLAVALYLIERGAGVAVRDKSGTDPLNWAAIRSEWVKKHQNVKLAAALLDRGAPIDGRDGRGYTPLLWAANRGAVKLIELLIERGADVNAKTTHEDGAGRTALMLTGSLPVVHALLAAGADPKATDADGMHTWEHHKGATAKLLKNRAGAK